MLQIAKLLLSLSAWLPISKIVELVKAAGELPVFSDPASVTIWLTRMGIGAPLADVLVAVIAQFASNLTGDELPEACDPDDLCEQLASENPSIDPVTIMAIIQAATQILGMLRAWRQKRNPAPQPNPTPVV